MSLSDRTLQEQTIMDPAADWYLWQPPISGLFKCAQAEKRLFKRSLICAHRWSGHECRQAAA
jgi:hypothetical protein